MKLSIALLVVLSVALVSVERAAAGRVWGGSSYDYGSGSGSSFGGGFDDPDDALFSSGRGKFVLVEDEKDKDPVFFHGLKKRYSYYGYKDGDFFLEAAAEDPTFVPFKSGGYYYDGSDYYYCYYDDYGTYYYFNNVRYYIIVKKIPVFFEKEDDGAVFVKDPKFFFFLKGGKFVKKFYDYGYGKKG